MYHMTDFPTWQPTALHTDGRWYPLRSLPDYGWPGVKQRICDAWEVLRGRAEAVQFPDQEPATRPVTEGR